MKSRISRSVAGLAVTFLGFATLLYSPVDKMSASAGMFTTIVSITLLQVGFVAFLVFGLKR